MRDTLEFYCALLLVVVGMPVLFCVLALMAVDAVNDSRKASVAQAGSTYVCALVGESDVCVKEAKE